MNKTEFYRLLKPSEVLKIESVIQNSDLRMSFKTAINTGMRYKELRLFADHPEWFHYNRKIIIIPKKYTKTREERKINLTPQFSELLYYFFHGDHRLKYSVYQSWASNLRRWAALAGVEHPEDLSAGSTRKAWESWLIESGLSLSRILASQGQPV
jgi:integrase